MSDEVELQQCACVFDEHMHEVMVCVYHADIAARLERAEARLAVTEEALLAADKQRAEVERTLLELTSNLTGRTT